jgi:hypothetical protein
MQEFYYWVCPIVSNCQIHIGCWDSVDPHNVSYYKSMEKASYNYWEGKIRNLSKPTLEAVIESDCKVIELCEKYNCL